MHIYYTLVSVALLMSMSLKGANAPSVASSSNTITPAAVCTFENFNYGSRTSVVLYKDGQPQDDGRQRYSELYAAVRNREYEERSQYPLGRLINVLIRKFNPHVYCHTTNGDNVPEKMHCMLKNGDTATLLCFKAEAALADYKTQENIAAEQKKAREKGYCYAAESPRKEETYCFHSQHELEAHRQEQKDIERADWQRFLAAHETDLFLCTDGAMDAHADDICPKNDEEIPSYLSRIFSIMPQEKDDEHEPISIEHLFSKDGLFWKLSWQEQRYLLPILIELNEWHVDTQLPFADMNALESATTRNDMELVFWLYDKGARVVNKNLIGKLVNNILESPDPRSVIIMKDLYDRQLTFDDRMLWSNKFAWAKDLPADLVKKKAAVLFSGRRWNKYGCFTPLKVRELPEETEGEKTIKEIASKHVDGFFCLQCEIL